MSRKPEQLCAGARIGEKRFLKLAMRKYLRKGKNVQSDCDCLPPRRNRYYRWV
jgi:hypothetical protein